MAEKINNNKKKEEEEEEEEMSELEEIFNKAANHLQTIVSKLDSGQLLTFYGLYKQATVGICDAPKPSWYQTQAKNKWAVWNELGDMTRDVAMKKYVNAITKIDPNWKNDDGSNASTSSWVVVSSLPNTDVHLNDDDKKLLDWVKEGNETRVKEMLMLDQSVLNFVDDDGMSPLHWAADRGHLTTIKYLIENGAHLDVQDNDGQTALHYAASCGHTETVEYLLSVGAKLLKDNDDMTPKDVADENVKAML